MDQIFALTGKEIVSREEWEMVIERGVVFDPLTRDT
jgi:hypothetical protein